MALTALERKRSQLERLRAKRKASSDSGEPDFKRPFNEWLEANRHNWEQFEMPLDIAGINPPEFKDDNDPVSATGEIDPETYVGKHGSLARAELTIDGLLEAARTLAEHVNAYKRDELSTRIEELDSADLSDHVIKKTAFADIVRLTKARDRLDKQVRYTLPEWKVQGE